jgi:hypothetical protein
VASELSHPAVERVLRALGGRKLTAYAVAERGGVAAVVVQDDVTRYVVLVERRNEEWVVPTAINGGRRDVVTPRPSKTESPHALQQLAVIKSGWPRADGERPDVAWCAVTGTAALDARDVLVATDSDAHTVPVRLDGYVLAVVRAGWQERPSVAVHTRDGRQVADQQR